MNSINNEFVNSTKTFLPPNSEKNHLEEVSLQNLRQEAHYFAKALSEAQAPPPLSHANNLSKINLTQEISKYTKSTNEETRKAIKAITDAGIKGTTMEVFSAMRELQDIQTRQQFVTKVVNKFSTGLDQLTRLT